MNRFHLDRRQILRGVVGSTALLTAPWIGRGAFAQDADIGPYQEAKIDWRQAEGETITVAVIPAAYFENLIAMSSQFEELTGVKLRFEKVPPAQIRQKVVLDMTSGTATYATHAADPMYYALYQANGWADALETYLDDPALTDKAWFAPEDIVPAWIGANSIDGKLYGIPYDGEVTLQVLRKDLYDAKGIAPAEDLDGFVANAAALHDPSNRVWGTALRGLAGAGQNIYIYSSLYREFEGTWMADGKLAVNGPEAEAALDWYIKIMKDFAPAAAQNWNWPDIADSFAQGNLASYIDAHSSASVINSADKSQVIGKIAYARWPKGPSGKRVSSIWNWGFPINSALTDSAKKATWLFIQWATCLETQARTSYLFDGPTKRSGVNRLSLWEHPDYVSTVSGFGENFVEATLTALREDTDIDWRPRVPQWPGIGDALATAVASALAGQASPKEALDAAQQQVAAMMG